MKRNDIVFGARFRRSRKKTRLPKDSLNDILGVSVRVVSVLGLNVVFRVSSGKNVCASLRGETLEVSLSDFMQYFRPVR